MVGGYIDDLVGRAADVSKVGAGRLDKECFMFVVRKDRRKFSRICTLLKANETLQSAQKVEMKEE
ncbi:hypothetical protein B484DRAFT_454381 [Ochromonadaceae sp. CCMP2298]|nr:hypothetical protein B484DRAFT_454381 [Ochromonadaceae sp. CCMP2298]